MSLEVTMRTKHRATTIRFRWIVPLSLAILGLGGCGEEAVEVETPLRPVRSERVVPISTTQPITLAGAARAGVESRLSFRVSGTVVTVAVERGDRVEPAQVLAKIDAVDYELKLEEAEATLAQAAASARRAESDYDRVRTLYENNNAAKSELEAARAVAESATAQLEAGQKRVEQARRLLSFTVLRAPSAGAIAEVLIEPNENVNAGQGVFLLTGGARPEVVVDVPEVSISAVFKGQTVRVSFDALPGRTFTGRVSEVGVAATGAASTYAVTAEIEDAVPEIRSGMAADVLFELERDATAGRLAVPLVAVGEDGDGRFVFVLERQGDGTGVVHRRSVVTGELLSGDGIEVREGLEEGEEVVTAGVRRLVDAMPVKVLDAAEAAG